VTVTGRLASEGSTTTHSPQYAVNCSFLFTELPLLQRRPPPSTTSAASFAC
jgi:hypothetical protein